MEIPIFVLEPQLKIIIKMSLWAGVIITEVKYIHCIQLT